MAPVMMEVADRKNELGRVRGILGEFSHLSNKLGVDFEKFGDLLFKFCNASLIELFSFRCQFLPSNHLLWLSSGERGPPLKKMI